MSMKTSLVMLAAVALAGCGGDDDIVAPDAAVDGGIDARVIDAGPRPDGGPECDVVTNDGCTPGMKCTLITTGGRSALRCGSGGSGTQGSPCTTTVSGDNCANGFLCLVGPGATASTCHKVCDPTMANTCPMSGTMMTACQVTVNGVADLNLCGAVRVCDPLDQSTCSASQGCFITAGADGKPLPQCLTAGSIAAGASCTGQGANACMRGSSCFNTGGGARRCFFHCRVPSGVPMCAGASTGGMTCGANTMISATFGTCQ